MWPSHDYIQKEINDSNDGEYYFEEPVFYGDKYLYDYAWYHEKFPVEWAVNHAAGTGPSQCENCDEYGSINGIFIGYCANCAQCDYKGERGRGFIESGIEVDEEMCAQYDIPFYTGDYPSAYDTYLKDVDITAIETVVNEHEYKGESICENEDGDEKEPEFDDYDLYGVCYEEGSVLCSDFEGGYNDF